MANIDLVIVLIIAFCALTSFLRLAMAEIFGLFVWVLAIALALGYASNFASLLPIDSVRSPLSRATISAIILFVGTLVVGGVLKATLVMAFASSRSTIFNRILGAFVGAVRGAIIITLLVLAANLAPELKQESWWQRSALIPGFQSAATMIHAQLPETVGRHFDINTISGR